MDGKGNRWKDIKTKKSKIGRVNSVFSLEWACLSKPARLAKAGRQGTLKSKATRQTARIPRIQKGGKRNLHSHKVGMLRTVGFENFSSLICEEKKQKRTSR